jgi:5-methylthioribose kinase
MEEKSMINLNVENVRDYLLEKGIAREGADVEVYEFPGGVSSTVIKVTLDNRKMVIKQALHKLKVKAEWYAPLWRSHVEQDCIEYLSSILPHGSVPEIFFKDYENYLFVMSCAPDGAGTWKSNLLKGNVNQNIARKVGHILATIQNNTTGNSTVKKRFEKNDIYIAGRIDPYYRTVQNLYPELGNRIEEIIQMSLNTRMVLTLADYSPKNMLVKGEEVMVIDHEAAHWGDPYYDAAFFLNHLFLKSVHNAHIREHYFKAINNFWEAYTITLRHMDTDDLERGVVKHLGGLILARVDGKSPAEYLDDGAKEVLRNVSKELITGEYERLSHIMEKIGEKLR